MPFTLTHSGTDFSFDTDGNVTSNNAAAGKWSVDATNKIALAPTGGGAAIAFPVDWSFIDNQLWVVVSGKKLFNFHAKGMPDYSVVANQLQVTLPLSTFAFTLACTFSMDEDLDLLVKIGTIQSTLVGTLEDTNAQFIYRFFDDTFGAQDALILQGEWKRDDAVDGAIHMRFEYQAAGATQSIAIPRAFDVNPFTNSLRLSYQKAGQSCIIELAGEIKISNNHTLVFDIKKSGMPGSSSLEINFQLAGTGRSLKFLELTILKKSNGSAGTTLTIGGALSANIGAGGLTLNFRYSKSTGATPVPVTLAVNGTFTRNAGGTVTFSYVKDGTGTTFSVIAKDFRIGPTGLLTAAFEISPGKAVRGFIAISW